MLIPNAFCERIHAAKRELYRPLVLREQTLGFVAHENAERLRRHDRMFCVLDSRIEIRPRNLPFEELTLQLNDVIRAVYDDDQKGFGQWCDEETPVVPAFGEAPVFSIQRAAVAFFGTLTTGVHLNVFNRQDNRINLVLARRAEHISSYPGALDQPVAGFLPVGADPLKKLTEEADEEAGLDSRDIANARCAGSIEFALDRDPGLQRGAVYVFDLETEPARVLENRDGEVSDFMTATMDEAGAMVLDGLFKFDSALVTTDFLLRHGAFDCASPGFLKLRNALSGAVRLS